MRRKLLVLPVDARPVVCGQLQYLAQLADWDIALPPTSMLGHFRQSANHDRLGDWLVERAGEVDGFVLSLDTLLYGGLIASRISPETAGGILARAEWLETLNRIHPAKPIYGFLTTLRISDSNINEEEKPYWSSYGELIWKWSYHADRHRTHGINKDWHAAKEARLKIPADIQRDYVETRARNLKITGAMLDFARRGVIERLIIARDDNAPHGFHVAERQGLEKKIADAGLRDKVEMYCGADEVAWTLAARMISRLENRRPRKVYLSWHHPEDAGTMIPRYEDQPIGAAVENQLLAAGADIASDIKGADLVLAIHTANQPQGDWALGKSLKVRKPVDSAWMAALRRWRDGGLQIAIADLAHANGGDPGFVGLALSSLDFGDIIAYGAWNTASNSLGTVAAQIQLSPLGRTSAPGTKLKLIRLIDDVFYQAAYRQLIRRKIASGAWTLEEAKPHFRHAANEWLRANSIQSAEVRNAFFPWGRSFEIGFEVESGLS